MATTALPYYDKEIDNDPSLRQRIERELAREMAAMGKEGIADSLEQMERDGRIQPGSDAFKDMISRPAPMAALDTTRHGLPVPEQGLDASEEEWKRALDNATAQNGWMESRLVNLELMKKYGANHWRLTNYTVKAAVETRAALLSSQRDATTELNRARRTMQTQAGEQLSALDRKWGELLSAGLQVEAAILGKQAEVRTLQRRRDELRQRLAQMDEEDAVPADGGGVA